MSISINYNATSIIAEAVHQIVNADIGVKMRRSFAWDGGNDDPVAYVTRLQEAVAGQEGYYENQAVRFLLLPVTSVFAPLTPGEGGNVFTMARYLSFLEVQTRYAAMFFREAIAREADTRPSPNGRQVESYSKLITRIREFCLHTLDPAELEFQMGRLWAASQSPAMLKQRFLNTISTDHIRWSAGADAFEIGANGMQWYRNGVLWFGDGRVDGARSVIPASTDPELLDHSDELRQHNQMSELHTPVVHLDA